MCEVQSTLYNKPATHELGTTNTTCPKLSSHLFVDGQEGGGGGGDRQQNEFYLFRVGMYSMSELVWQYVFT
jgi:hypothetical protein